MEFATWNVNSIRARKDRVLAWLDRQSPDVLCMQETKVVDSDFPGDEFTELGYSAAIHGQKAYNGVAILARRPITDVARGFDDGEPEEQSRLIAATVAGVRVICVYVPNGQSVGSDKYAYKLDWLGRLRRYLDRRCDKAKPVLLCGDFNVAPRDRDVWSPPVFEGSVLCTDAERAALQTVLDWGFSDAYRHHHADEIQFSWWDYRALGFPKNRGLRIDHVYVTAPLLERSTETVIDRDERKGKLPSDHAPVIASFGD